MKLASILLTLTLTSSALAGEVFLPAVFRGDGANGTRWRTEVAIANVSRTPAHVTITFLDGTEGGSALFKTLMPMEGIDAHDILHEWFELESGSGLLRVTWDEPNAKIAARGRIYNVDANGGEYGQGLPSFQTDRLVSDYSFPGVSGVGGNRTNLGIANPHNAPVLVWIGLYDAAGNERGGLATYVNGRSVTQLNDIFTRLGVQPLDAALVTVSATNATVYPFASVVRNDTGDATFIAPIH